MKHVTRTTNPIHFEDLEPKRFEDLVRVLAYDFKNWRTLEATGRSGSDEGYDARGWEIVNDPNAEEESEEEGAGQQLGDRLWMVQCKREKNISPAKMKKYLAEILPDGSEVPYGVVFAAACDFSKVTRDVFREELSKKGVQEFHLWGKAYIEDQLYQPKNDHILYAFFNISFVLQRRTVKSKIKNLLATKRKVINNVGGIKDHSIVLVRDAEDEQYPYSGSIKNFDIVPPWKIYEFVGHSTSGIRLRTRRFMGRAKFDKDILLEWDIADSFNNIHPYPDPWGQYRQDHDLEWRIRDFWNALPKDEQVTLEIERVIPYERIVDIDKHGDMHTPDTPHIYVHLEKGSWFAELPQYWTMFRMDKSSFDPDWKYYVSAEDEAKRNKFFPKKFPKPKPLKPLPPLGTKPADSNPSE